MAKKDTEAQESKEDMDKNWKASMPIQIQFQFIGPDNTKQEVVAQVLQALQLVTKFDIAKLG